MRALLPALLCCRALAQTPIVQTVTVPSQALPGSRKATVLLPGGYDRSPARYPVLYLLHGITGSHEDWTHKTNLTAYAAPLPLIIVMPDGENSWYSNSATRPDYRYEDFIVKELVPGKRGFQRPLRYSKLNLQGKQRVGRNRAGAVQRISSVDGSCAAG